MTAYSPARMEKNGTQAITNAYADLTPWTEVDTGGYTSTCADTNLTLLVPATTSEGRIYAEVPFSGSNASRSHTIRIVNTTTSTTLATGDAVSGASGTCKVGYSGALTANDHIKIQVTASGTSGGTVSSGATCFMIIDGKTTDSDVTFDAVGAGAYKATYTVPLTWTHVMGGTGSNSIVLVGVSARVTTAMSSYTVTADYDGHAMTALTDAEWSGGNGGWTKTFYYLNPAAGSKTITVTVSAGTAPAFIECNSVSYLSTSGVDGTPSTGVGSSFRPAVLENSAAQRRVVAFHGARYNLSTPVGNERFKSANGATTANLLISDLCGGLPDVYQEATATNSNVWGSVGISLTYASSSVNRSVALAGAGVLSATATMYRIASAVAISGHGALTATAIKVSTGFVDDTFADTSGVALESHTGEVGGTWAKNTQFSSGAGAISDANALYTSAGPAVYYASGSPSSADYEVSADMYILSSGVNVEFGVTGRTSTNADTMYDLVWKRIASGGGTWTVVLHSYVAGTPATLGSYGITAPANGVTHTLKLKMVGDQISGYYDGSLVLGPYTDTAVTAAGKAGIRASSTTGNAISGIHMDSILAVNAITSVNRSVALAGAGALTATAVATKFSFTKSLTGTGALTAVTKQICPVTKNLTGLGALTATTKQKFAVTKNFTGVGSLTATTTQKFAVTKAITGTGALTVVTKQICPFTKNLTGTGALTVTTSQKFAVTKNFTGTGALTAVTKQICPLTKNLTGAGALTAATSQKFTLTTDFTGSGALTAITSQKFAVTTGFTGSVALTATAAMYQIASVVALSGTGVLTASAYQKFAVAENFTGTGVLTATAQMSTVARSAPLAGSGALTTIEYPKFAIATDFTGIGSLTATTSQKFALTKNLIGSGALTATAQMYRIASAAAVSGAGTLTATTQQKIIKNFTGAGALTATATMYRIASAASFSGTAALTATKYQKFAVTTDFTGTGALTATARMYQIASVASLSGTGTLTATKYQKFAVTTGFTGQGALTATATAVVMTYGVALPTWQTNGFSGIATTQALTDIHALGAGWVSICLSWYMNSRTDNSLDGTWNTTDANVVNAITVAHDQGLKVMLKPQVVNNDGGVAVIAPSDPAAWFNNTGTGLSGGYQYFLSHYATIAADNDVEMFCIGTELPTMAISTYSSNWTTVINAVKSIFTGELTYATRAIESEWEAVPFWSQLDYIGINAYWTLQATPTSDVPTLTTDWASWTSILSAFSASNGNKKILFPEAGYPGVAEACVSPWDESETGTDDSGVAQNACYQALFASCVGQSWWQGMFAWSWWDNTGAYRPKGLSIGGKLAASTVATQWGGTSIAPVFMPLKIYKGYTAGGEVCASTWTAIPYLWAVNDATYGTTNDGPVLIGITQTNVTMSATFAFTGSDSGATHTIRIRRTSGTPATIATGTGITGASGTCTVTATLDVVAGETYTVEGQCTGSTTYGTWTSGTSNALVISTVVVTPTFSGSGTLTTTTRQICPVTKNFAGTGSLTATTVPKFAITKNFTGTGALTATAYAKFALTKNFTGTGTLTATARMYQIASSASFTGTGTLTTTTYAKFACATALDGAGALSATAVPTFAVTATLTGHGALAATAAATQFTIPAALTGVGALSADAIPGFTRSAVFSGAGALAATATMYQLSVTVTMAGHGALVAEALTGYNRPATLTGYGTLSAAATMYRIAASAQLSGHGALTAVTYPKISVSANLTGSGTLSATAQMYRIASAVAVSGTGVLTAATSQKFALTKNFIGIGALTATARMYRIASSAALSGHGTLTATTSQKFTLTKNFTGAGALTATAAMYRIAVSAARTGNGTLTAIASARFSRSVQMSGTGSLSASAYMYRMTVSAVMSGTGTLTTSVLAKFSRSVALAGQGSLTAAATMYRIARTVALSGAGSLTAAASGAAGIVGHFYGAGTLGATARLYRIAVPVGIAGSGALSIATRQLRAGDVHGIGTLTATAVATKFVVGGILGGSGTLTAAAYGSESVTVPLSGTGVLTATAVAKRFVLTTAAQGTGRLTALAFARSAAAASLGGAGALSVLTTQASTPLLSGAGALDVFAYPRQPLDARLDSTGVLTASAWATGFVTAELTAVGTLTAVVTQVAYSYIETLGQFDLTGSAISVQMLTAPTAPAQSMLYLLDTTRTHEIDLAWQDGDLVARIDNIVVDSTTYDPLAHAWQRIRHADGMLFFETGADGREWNVLGSTAAPDWINAVYVGLKILGLGIVVYDNLNVAATTATLSGAGRLSSISWMYAITTSSALDGFGALGAYVTPLMSSGSFFAVLG